MRPGQQNKRMRGRGRRGPNPLSRSYESNGPDVKIRGTAAHIAEKYMQLARDANAVGDPVAAENYLQHAEHYFRIIAAAQAAQPQQSGAGDQQGQPRQRYNGADRYASEEEDADDTDQDSPREQGQGEERPGAPSTEASAESVQPQDNAEAAPAAPAPVRRRRRRSAEPGDQPSPVANGANGASEPSESHEEPAREPVRSTNQRPAETASADDVNA